jgi:hypothetical protein
MPPQQWLMIWHFGDTPDTPCFDAPVPFLDATDCELLTYDRITGSAVEFARILANSATIRGK